MRGSNDAAVHVLTPLVENAEVSKASLPAVTTPIEGVHGGYSQERGWCPSAQSLFLHLKLQERAVSRPTAAPSPSDDALLT